MVVGITGTRAIENVDAIRLKRLTSVLQRYNTLYKGNLLIVHGGAHGVDKYVHNFCIDENISVKVRPAYKECNFSGVYLQETPEPPLKRNKIIVNECNILLAVPNNPEEEELRSGTWSTIRYAEKQNQKVIKI